MEFARSFLAEARIESDDFHDLDGGDIEFLGNPFNGLRANETVAVLDFGSDKTSTAGDFTIVFPTADASNAIVRVA